jgi:hypothetical protein
MDESINRRMRVATGGNTCKILQEYVDIDQIPEEYGGYLRHGNESHSVRFTSPFEVELREHVDSVLADEKLRSGPIITEVEDDYPTPVGA